MVVLPQPMAMKLLWRRYALQSIVLGLIMSRQNIKNLPALGNSRRLEAQQLDKGVCSYGLCKPKRCVDRFGS